MRKSYIVTSVVAGALILGGAGAYAYMNSSKVADNVIVDETVTIKLPKAAPSTTNAPSPTPIPSTPETSPVVPGEEPLVQNNPAPVSEPIQEYGEVVAPIDPATRQWSDGYGNQYIGPNAISCADGSEPTTIGYGMPLQCAFSGDAILVE